MSPGANNLPVCDVDSADIPAQHLPPSFPSGANSLFAAAVDPAETTVQHLPPIVLVFGGPLGDPRKSGRQMFLNWLLSKSHPVSPLVRTPEQFQDWSDFEGYQNLIDFERDAGSLARAIVLFSESEGSFAELGAFCMDEVLAERLFVVIEKEHYSAGSFIANGPIKKIESLHDNSICVVESINPEKLQAQLPDVAQAIQDKINSSPKTAKFNPQGARDQFLLVADLVELFGALTAHELTLLLSQMGVTIPKKRLDQIIKQLLRFELVVQIGTMTKRYLVPPKTRHAYLNYSAPKGHPKFDRTRFKLKSAFPWVAKDALRLQAYSEVHRGA